MDSRTNQLLRALDPASVDLLVLLARRSLSEKELVAASGGLNQPMVHKKLRRLVEVGLVRQSGVGAGRGRPWSLSVPQPTSDFLLAVLGLTDAVESVDNQDRRELRKSLSTEETGIGLRLVSEGTGSQQKERKRKRR